MIFINILFFGNNFRRNYIRESMNNKIDDFCPSTSVKPRNLYHIDQRQPKKLFFFLFEHLDFFLLL